MGPGSSVSSGCSGSCVDSSDSPCSGSCVGCEVLSEDGGSDVSAALFPPQADSSARHITSASSSLWGWYFLPVPRGPPARQQKRRRDSRFPTPLQTHSLISPLAKRCRTGYNENWAQLYLLCGRGRFSCIRAGGCCEHPSGLPFLLSITIIYVSTRKCKRHFRKRRGSEGKRSVPRQVRDREARLGSHYLHFLRLTFTGNLWYSIHKQKCCLREQQHYCCWIQSLKQRALQRASTEKSDSLPVMSNAG